MKSRDIYFICRIFGYFLYIILYIILSVHFPKAEHVQAKQKDLGYLDLYASTSLLHPSCVYPQQVDERGTSWVSQLAAANSRHPHPPCVAFVWQKHQSVPKDTHVLIRDLQSGHICPDTRGLVMLAWQENKTFWLQALCCYLSTRGWGEDAPCNEQCPDKNEQLSVLYIPVFTWAVHLGGLMNCRLCGYTAPSILHSHPSVQNRPAVRWRHK